MLKLLMCKNRNNLDLPAMVLLNSLEFPLMYHLFFSSGFPPALSHLLSGPLHQLFEVWILYGQPLSISSAVVFVHFVFPYCTTWHSTLCSVYPDHGNKFNFEVTNLKLLNLNQ